MVDIKAAIGQPPHNDLSGFFRVRNTTGKVIAAEQVGQHVLAASGGRRSGSEMRSGSVEIWCSATM
jgi:hypothetical protein